jgi:hypothetical protein
MVPPHLYFPGLHQKELLCPCKSPSREIRLTESNKSWKQRKTRHYSGTGRYRTARSRTPKSQAMSNKCVMFPTLILLLMVPIKPGRLGVTESNRVTAALQFCQTGQRVSRARMYRSRNKLHTVPFQYRYRPWGSYMAGTSTLPL